MSESSFEWDEAENLENQRKHGVLPAGTHRTSRPAIPGNRTAASVRPQGQAALRLKQPSPNALTAP